MTAHSLKPCFLINVTDSNDMPVAYFKLVQQEEAKDLWAE